MEKWVQLCTFLEKKENSESKFHPADREASLALPNLTTIEPRGENTLNMKVIKPTDISGLPVSRDGLTAAGLPHLYGLPPAHVGRRPDRVSGISGGFGGPGRRPRTPDDAPPAAPFGWSARWGYKRHR